MAEDRDQVTAVIPMTNGELQNTDDVFSEEPSQDTVKVKGKDGKVREYTIMEMDGPTLGRWQASQINRLRSYREGVDTDDTIPTLISLCLFDEAGNPVPKKAIMTWSSSCQNGIYRKCEKINGLNEDSRRGKKG
jgi:hypothetical protein